MHIQQRMLIHSQNRHVEIKMNAVNKGSGLHALIMFEFESMENLFTTESTSKPTRMCDLKHCSASKTDTDSTPC